MWKSRLPPMAGERGLGRELAPVRRPRAQPARDPQARRARGAGVQRTHEALEARALGGGQQAPEIEAQEARARLAEDPLGRRIGVRHAQLLVELDDGVHGTVHEARQLLLALAHTRLGAQPPQLRRGPLGEELEDVQEPRLPRHRACVEHGQVSEDRPVGLLERHAHVADRPDRAHVGVSRVEFEHAIRVQEQPPSIDDVRARRAVDGGLPGDELVPQPEGQRAQAASFRLVLGHPGADRPERAREVLDQSAEEGLARLLGRALEEQAQRHSLVERPSARRGCILARGFHVLAPRRAMVASRRLSGQGAEENPSADRARPRVPRRGR